MQNISSDNPGGGGGGGGGYSGGGGSRNSGGGGGSYLTPSATNPEEVQGQNQAAGDVTISLVSATAATPPPANLLAARFATVETTLTNQLISDEQLVANQLTTDEQNVASQLTYDEQLVANLLTADQSGVAPSAASTSTGTDPSTGQPLTSADGTTTGGTTAADQASITPSSLGQAGTPSFLAADPAQQLLTYTYTANADQPTSSIVLQPGGVDQVTGFNPSTDMLDLRQALAASQLNLGGDASKLGNYVQVNDTGNDATLSFNPQGLASGPGSTLAVLHGVGPGVTLGTLISDHALAIT